MLFLAVTFAFSTILSAIPLLFTSEKPSLQKSQILPSVVSGACFAGANIHNTIIVGKLSSTIFFPVNGISVILLSVIASMLLYKEKLTKKTGAILVLALASIIVFSI